MVLGVADRLLARQRKVTDRREALEVRSERRDAHLEAHLVVALARAAVGDRLGIELARSTDEVLDDRRARERRDERVPVEVERVGPQRRHAVLLGELVAGVRDVGLDGPAVEGTLADDLEVFTALTDVDGHSDDLGPGSLGDPSDSNGGVQAARIGEHDAFSHGFVSFSTWCVWSKSVIGSRRA